jgi:oligoribonuclease (3'-5' exoribonuclease)
MNYVSIDLETTGLDPATCQILSIAAVVDGRSYATLPVNELPHFHMAIKHEWLSGSAIALAMNASLIQRITTNDIRNGTPGEVETYLNEFLSTQLGPAADRPNITAAGKNYGRFDHQFLVQQMPTVAKRIRHRSIDPGTLYGRDEDAALPDTAECCQRMEACYRPGKFPPKHPHDALDDARWVVRLIRHKWQGTNVD